jgi:3-hydroxybutyryl-CoA dehydratase
LTAYTPGQELRVVNRQVNKEHVQAYAQASGDHNPLHLDEAFAATTQFGRPIAHGMLVLAMISEMLAQNFGQHWLDSGSLKARFKGPVYVGEGILISGLVSKESLEGDRRLLTCNVVLKNSKGEEAVTATAMVALPEGL